MIKTDASLEFKHGSNVSNITSMQTSSEPSLLGRSTARKTLDKSSRSRPSQVDPMLTKQARWTLKGEVDIYDQMFSAEAFVKIAQEESETRLITSNATHAAVA